MKKKNFCVYVFFFWKYPTAKCEMSHFCLKINPFHIFCLTFFFKLKMLSKGFFFRKKHRKKSGILNNLFVSQWQPINSTSYISSQKWEGISVYFLLLYFTSQCQSSYHFNLAQNVIYISFEAQNHFNVGWTNWTQKGFIFRHIIVFLYFRRVSFWKWSGKWANFI